MNCRLLPRVLLIVVFLPALVSGSPPVRAQGTTEAPGGSAPVATPAAEPEKVSSEGLALEAAAVQGEHCAEATSNRETEGLRSISTVSNTWVRVSEQYDRTGDDYLLYWRAVLAQCMDQESRALEDFRGFLAKVGESSLWTGLIRDARRRIRHLERKSAGLAGGAGAAPSRSPRKIGGLVAGGSLATGSALTGLLAVLAWEDALEHGRQLEGVEFADLTDEGLESFRDKLADGEQAQTESRVLTAVSIATGLGALASFVLGAAADSPAGLAAPVMVPTDTGAAIFWEGRW